MKNLIFVILFLLLVGLGTSKAQSASHKTGISFKALFMDYQSQNGGDIAEFRSYRSGFEIGIHRNLSKGLNLNIPFKIGVVQSHKNVDSYRKSVYGADLQLEYHFYDDSYRLIPYLTLGVGGVTEDDGEFNVQAPVGIGLNIRIAKNSYINLESEYRKSFTDDRDNLHHGLGFVYLFGKAKKEVIPEEVKNDADNDGLVDDIDLCPQAPGPKELNGCPDTDGDGIADYEDECPEKMGSKELRGCPDTDGDGISDLDDDCPNMAGDRANNGCPDNDRDNDGIDNDVDKCPDEAGPASNQGCPTIDTDGDGVPDDRDRCPNAKGSISADGCPDADNDGIADFQDKCPDTAGEAVYEGCPDTDGDGIDDSRDKCPNTPGTVDRNGCPELAIEDKKVLDLAMRAVQFDTGRSSLKPESGKILDQIGEIMARYPDFVLSIGGHTDNTGTSRTNQLLSERRAKACHDYLKSKGISESRLSFAGYGESRPIANNNTLSGRALNRRVEFNLKPEGD